MTGLDEVCNKITDADLVLVGIGEEFNDAGYLNSIEKYAEIKEIILKEKQHLWLLPYLQHLFLKNDSKLISAYKNLNTILKNKNSFVITTCANSFLTETGFKKERVVVPCGGFNYVQCESSGCDYLSDATQDFISVLQENLIDKVDFPVIDRYTCPLCGGKLAFNNIYLENYNEKGYLPQWNIYKKWLEGTLNKKLCVLELGVSFSMPSVIRFPFEKIVFFNQKSAMIRVNEKFFQLSSEIAERSFSIPENAVDFLNEL